MRAWSLIILMTCAGLCWSADQESEPGFEWVRGVARTGKRSIRITDASTKRNYTLAGPRLPVRPGQAVWVGAWYKSAGEGSAMVLLSYYRGDGKRLPGTTFSAVSDGKWRAAWGKHVVPAGAKTVEVWLHCWGRLPQWWPPPW